MRPAPQRLGDLRHQLSAAQAVLAQALAVEAEGTDVTAADLANAQQVAVCLAAELADNARSERVLQEMIREGELRLAGLRAALTKSIVESAKLTGEADVAGLRVIGARAKLFAERGRVAPLIARREKDVERLERRIAMVEAHHAARSAVKSAPAPRVVLGFVQAPEAAS